jgi:pimeloyl-ACP methyl ester carboxylesterase
VRRISTRTLLTGLLAAPLLSGALAATHAPPAAALGFTPCPAGPAFSCAAVPVPLSRSGTAPGTISLSVERKLAGATQSQSAVVGLAGGPGQAALPLGEYIAKAISPALVTRDLLVFDQRGTGASDPLSCPALSSAAEIENTSTPEGPIARCALQIGPARGAFTTEESVADIESIRQAAGYEKLVLYGTSYGTKVALEYAERYPQHVESLVLDSTEPPEGPEPFHVGTFKAIGPMLAELCSQGACNGVSASPLADVAHLAAETAQRPLIAATYDGHGKRVRVPLTSRDLLDLFLAGDENPALRAEMPAAVHSALRGDPAALARMSALGGIHPKGKENGEIDNTLFLDTSCEEIPFPWQRAAPAATRAVEAEAALNAIPGSDFYPFGPEAALLDQLIPVCVTWPDASPPPTVTDVLPNVPTLILSGGQDLRTPTENARRVASMIPDAQLVKAPYTGHSVLGSDFSGCAQAAVGAFFTGTPVKACGTSVNRFPPAPLAPTRLSALTPTPGLGGAPGRTLTATIDSVVDLRRTITEIGLGLGLGSLPAGVDFGGLRGGSVKITKAGVVLDRLIYVPGVQISGLIPIALLLKNTGPAANLSIAGASAADGRLHVGAGGHVSGVLAGRSFHLVVAARVKAARVGPAGQADRPTGPVGFPLAGLAKQR